jgi:hypothetical protein
MSSEGVTFLLRGLLVLFLVVSGAIVRTFIGPSKRRGHIMLAGMLGGMGFGALVSYSIPSSLRMDESAILAVVGMMLGWCLAWFFARRLPREAN